MTYTPSPARYDSMQYRRCGRSGLKLPAISLGLWHNFGHDTAPERSRKLMTTAFDLGITHFDLANNYGPPPGSAEEFFGSVMTSDFKPYRDEMIVSTKAGWGMWDGPYGDLGSRKYLLASLDQSLKRMSSTMSTSSIRTASIPTRRSRRRWARSTRRCARARRSMSASPPTATRRRRRRPRSCGGSARRR